MAFPVIPLVIAAVNAVSQQIASHQGTSNPVSPFLSLASMAYSGYQYAHNNPDFPTSDMTFNEYQDTVNSGESSLVDNMLSSPTDINDYETFMSIYGNNPTSIY